jgi:uncharacterized protein with PIN domain
MKKHKFRWGEEEYTICITQDDWWMDDPVDMSERMIRGANEFALEHGMAPAASTCINCGGTYVDTKKDYHIGAKILHDLDQRKCWNCGHTIFPPQSVERIDEVLVAKK